MTVYEFLTTEEEVEFKKWARDYPGYTFRRIDRDLVCPLCGAQEHELIMYPLTSANGEILFSIIHFCPCCYRGIRDGEKPYWYYVKNYASPQLFFRKVVEKLRQLGCPVCGESIPASTIQKALMLKTEQKSTEQLVLSF